MLSAFPYPATRRAITLLGTGLLGICLAQACRPAHPTTSADIAAAQRAGKPCDSNDDCVLTNFAGCCLCCGCVGAGYALHVDDLERLQDGCDGVECDCQGNVCSACPDPPPGPTAAVCAAGRCTAR